MADLKIHPWEPEESVGALWHRFVTRAPAEPEYGGAAVTLDEMRPRIRLVFRGLGGSHGAEIAAATEHAIAHRRSLWRRIGHGAEYAARAAFDGETLSLPERIASFPDRHLNEQLYIWLAAWCAFDPEPPLRDQDPLRDDLMGLIHDHIVTRTVLDACPGLRPAWSALTSAVLAARQPSRLPPMEEAVEQVLRTLHGADEPETSQASAFLEAVRTGALPDEWRAGPDYKPHAPSPLWPARNPVPAPLGDHNRRDEHGSGASAAGPQQRKQAARKKSDQANRRDSLILNRFETILSWTDFLNLNRRIEDDDTDNARKAAEDANELAVTDIDQRPATRLAFDLDMAPQDVARSALAGESLYPEWDYRKKALLPAHCRVLANVAETADPQSVRPHGPAEKRRAKRIRRQFEALRPRRTSIRRQVDGDDFDLDAVVASQVDLKVSGHGSDRFYCRTANAERDLAIATLIDTSRSTESAVGERSVISVAREALVAFGHGLAATGDAHAIYAFSSLRRDRVFVNRVKAFDEAMGTGVEARIAALRPGFYTRLGAAMRHVSAELSNRQARRRMLLVITDGKPNDLDHYEGRYGVEDSRAAVFEARRLGHAVFAIAIDRKAMSYIPHIFGQNAYAIVSHPERLAASLPLIYRQLVT